MSAHLGGMTDKVLLWACDPDTSHEIRMRSLRNLMADVGEVSKIFGMRHYFTKRCMEIILLGLLGLPQADRVSAADFDELADVWPIASGTAAGIKLIFPTAHGDKDLRECLRALQRGLGNGVRHVPLVRHSHVSMWTSDQRAGIKGTLHRLAREVQRASTTCTLLVVRFGRHFLGCYDRLAMHISSFKSTLLVGPPGVGKTTFLREYTRVLSEVHHRRPLGTATARLRTPGGCVPAELARAPRSASCCGFSDALLPRLRTAEARGLQSI
jgi:hypothetical protein